MNRMNPSRTPPCAAGGERPEISRFRYARADGARRADACLGRGSQSGIRAATACESGAYLRVAWCERGRGRRCEESLAGGTPEGPPDDTLHNLECWVIRISVDRIWIEKNLG